MAKDINQWTRRIDNTTAEFFTRFGSLTHEEINWKPNPETWSIAQNIDHLMVINRSYFPILSDLKTGKYQPPLIAKFGFIASFFGKMILNGVKPDQKKKMKTFRIWEPTVSLLDADILKQFEAHQTELKQHIEAAEAFVNAGTVISSPANKNIVYTLEMAFDILVTHEQRHLIQAQHMLEWLEKSRDHSLGLKP